LFLLSFETNLIHGLMALPTFPAVILEGSRDLGAYSFPLD